MRPVPGASITGSKILTPLDVSGSDDEIEPWISLAPLLRTGWFPGEVSVSGGQHPRYYRHAGRVWFGGTIEYDGGVGADPQFPLDILPVGYRPDRLTNAGFFLDEGGDRYLTGDWVTGGSVALELDGTPGLVLGDVMVLDGVSYRHA